MKENQIGSCQKCLLVKKASRANSIKKDLAVFVKSRGVRATTKRKIILLWP